jgi:hypothetical protein
MPRFGGAFLWQEHQNITGRYRATIDGIVIGVAVLCVVALALLLTAKLRTPLTFPLAQSG